MDNQNTTYGTVQNGAQGGNGMQASAQGYGAQSTVKGAGVGGNQNPNKQRIVAVRKDGEGELLAFKLDNGQELGFKDCYHAIQRGEIEGVIATSGREGADVIRSVPDGDPSNNLRNLPTF